MDEGKARQTLGCLQARLAKVRALRLAAGTERVRGGTYIYSDLHGAILSCRIGYVLKGKGEWPIDSESVFLKGSWTWGTRVLVRSIMYRFRRT